MPVSIIVALAILALASFYLASLGVVALVRPESAHLFLSGFAQTRRANWIEAAVRGAVGLAFVVAAPVLPWALAMRVIGGILVLTAAAMPLFPEQHRQIAARSVAGIATWMLPIGVASLLLAVALLAALFAALQ